MINEAASIVRRYTSEAVSIGIGMVFVLYVIYVNREQVNLDIVLKFSLIERVVIVLMTSYVVGKVASKVGDVMSWAVIVFFQRDRLKTLWTKMQKFRVMVDYARKPSRSEEDKNVITVPQVLRYIGSDEEVRARYEMLLSEKSAWTTIAGIVAIAIFFKLTVPLSVPQASGILISVVFFALYSRYRLASFWDNCVSCIVNKTD